MLCGKNENLGQNKCQSPGDLYKNILLVLLLWSTLTNEKKNTYIINHFSFYCLDR